VAKKAGPEFKSGRQEEGTVDCVPDSTGSCITNYQEYLESARSALLFRVNQMDSTDKKLKRMKVFKARVENKAGKAEFFENVTHVLRESMGGDIANPVCTSLAADAGQRLAAAVLDLYNRLDKCKTLVTQNCFIDDVVVGYNATLFAECDATNTALMAKVTECLNYQLTRKDSRSEDEKCLCWETVKDNIESLKSNSFIPQGNLTRNCIQAIAHSAPLIKDLQLSCTNTVIDCKKDEDEAIGVVNTCNKNAGGRMLVSNFRSFMDQEEDYRDEDYDLYGDEDYYTFDEDYYY